MERARQITAALVGIIVIVILIALARWTGDRIRERFLTSKTETTASQTSQTNQTSQSNPTNQIVSEDQTVQNYAQMPAGKVATYSAIPSTGPEDIGYFFIGLLFVSGLSASFLANRLS